MEDVRGRRDPPLSHPRALVWAGDLVAVAFVVALAVAPFPEEALRPGSTAVLVLVLAPALVIPLRRRWPRAALAACVLLYGAACLLGTVSPGATLALVVTMFGVANRSTRRACVVVAAVTVAAVVLANLVAGAGGVLDPRLFQAAVTVAFAAAAGDATRSRREYIIAITERAERAEQTREAEARRRVSEERLRIARDLHDAVAHQIAVISLNAGVASSSLDAPGDGSQRAREALGTIRAAARSVLGEIGDLLSMLRADDSDDSDDDGAAAAGPQPGLARIDELVQQFAAAGLDVDVRVVGNPALVAGAVDRVAYHVVQEGLTNAHKHGTHQRAHVLIDVHDDEVALVVSNPAPPPRRDDSRDARRESAPAGAGGGHGLLGLRERVASVRGAVETGMTATGYRLTATLPLTKEPSTREASTQEAFTRETAR